MDREGALPSTPPAPNANFEGLDASPEDSKEIKLEKSSLSHGHARATWVGGLSVLCGLLTSSSGISVDDKGLPNKLVVILNSNTRSAWQFMLLTGCLPGLFGVLFNCAGSVDELHFEKQNDGSINMTRIRRHCSKVVKERAIKVQAVGNLDEHHNGGQDSSNSDSPKGSSNGLGSNSNSDSPTNSNNQKQVENLVVIDGATGAKIKEDHLIINGDKIIQSTFHTTTMDAEGDASTIIKAFCNLPLSYEEYSWVEENASSLLPDMSSMTQKELNLHKIQMLQLTLQRIQGLEEKQALGIVLTPQNLNMMGQRQAMCDQLACLKFNMSLEEVNDIKRINSGDNQDQTDHIFDNIDYVNDGLNDVADDGVLVLNYDDGASSDEGES